MSDTAGHGLLEPGERAALRTADAVQLLRSLPTGAADAVVTDPPYSSGGFVRSDVNRLAPQKYARSGYSGALLPNFSGDNRDQLSLLAFHQLWMLEALRATRPAGALVVFTDWRQLHLTITAVQVAGWVYRGVVPWVKVNPRPSSGRSFDNDCEYAVWATNGGRDMEPGSPRIKGHVQCGPVRSSRRSHITQKPEAVMEHLVAIAPEGGLVLDPFAGSGTTAVAAIRAGRRFLGCELDPGIAQGARDRIAAALAGQ